MSQNNNVVGRTKETIEGLMRAQSDLECVSILARPYYTDCLS